MVSKTRLQTQDCGLKTDVLRNPYRVFTREAWGCGFQSAVEYGSPSASALFLLGALTGFPRCTAACSNPGRGPRSKFSLYERRRMRFPMAERI